jgi:hypothetical protein
MPSPHPDRCWHRSAVQGRKHPITIAAGADARIHDVFDSHVVLSSGCANRGRHDRSTTRLPHDGPDPLSSLQTASERGCTTAACLDTSHEATSTCIPLLIRRKYVESAGSTILRNVHAIQVHLSNISQRRPFYREQYRRVRLDSHIVRLNVVARTEVATHVRVPLPDIPF